jgi:hypothetical protein
MTLALIFYSHATFPEPQPNRQSKCLLDPKLVEYKTVTQDDDSIVRDIESECAGVTEETLESCSVPNIVHLVIGDGFNFRFHHYLAMKSMHDRIKPEAIYVHTYGVVNDTFGYFKRANNEFKTTKILSRVVDTIRGIKVKAFEHKSDILRLEILIRYGGMYFDLDVFVLKSMRTFFNDEFTIGAQYWPNDDNPHGLCNGIMVAKRCSRFARNLYSHYENFDNDDWDFLSVRFPLELFYQDRSLARAVWGDTIVNEWPPEGYYRLKGENADFDKDRLRAARAIHLFYRSYGIEHNFDDIGGVNNTFGLMARQILGIKSPLDAQYI